MIDLFSGLGGFSLAARWTGRIETVAFCENDPFLRSGLQKLNPNSYVHADAKTFDGKKFRGVDIVCGGPPCQPASRAGQQKGGTDDRWLWNEAVRIAEESEATWCVFENPPGILDVGIDGILADLERIGYEVQPLAIPACAVDSPQDRERIWIIGCLLRDGEHGNIGSKPGVSKKKSNTGGIHEKTLCDGAKPRRKGSNTTFQQGGDGCVAEPVEKLLDDGKGIERGRGTWDDHFWIERVENGKNFISRFPSCFPDLVHGLQMELPKGFSSKFIKALGNTIVPQVAFEIFKAILTAEENL